MPKRFEVIRDELDNGGEAIQVAFTGDNIHQVVYLTLEESKRLIARLLEVNKEVSIFLPKRRK